MSKNKIRKHTASDDMKPQPLQVGKWTIEPLNVNTLILLEKIGSPFMDENFDSKTSKYKDGSKLTMAEMIRSFYVMSHAKDPRLDEQVDDPATFNRCVSNMAREISMADLARMTAGVNSQMGRVNQALMETGAEGSGPKKGTGPAS